MAASWKEESSTPTSLEAIKDRLEIVSAVAQAADAQSKADRKTDFDKQAHAKPLQIRQQVLLRVPRENKGKPAEWRGPYIILDQPTEVTYELNTRANKRASRVFHRNSLKPHIVAVNFMKVTVATRTDEEGVIPLPHTQSVAAGNPRAAIFV